MPQHGESLLHKKMATNHGNITDETSDEISASYRDFANLTQEDDENDEGIAEYLDLEMENASVRDTEEYRAQVSRATPPSTNNKSRIQSSVLKNNKNPRAVGTKNKKRNSRTKPVIAAKSTVHIPDRSIMRTRSSTVNNEINSTKLENERTITSKRESDQAHAAVDEINSKLAISANYANEHAENDRKTGRINSTVKMDINESGSLKKTDLDSLDLFFQSMAQTVVSLPASIQAGIKMEICKVIAMAEMKYSTTDDASLKLAKH